MTKPIHIMRWAPADYVNDPAVKLALAKRDYLASAFYPLFLFHAYIQGGELPANPVALGAILGMRAGDVSRALGFWVEQGKVKEAGGRLYHDRVRRDIAAELEFRASQSEKGKLGGRPVKAEPLSKLKPVLDGRLSPPSPLPAPLPAPAPTPASRQEPLLPPADSVERRITERADVLRTKLYGLIARMEALDPERRDPTELMRLVTSYERRDGQPARGVVNASLLTYERLEKSIGDAEHWIGQWSHAADTKA